MQKRCGIVLTGILAAAGLALAACGQPEEATSQATPSAVTEEAAQQAAEPTVAPQAEQTPQAGPTEAQRAVVIEALEGTVEVRPGPGEAFEAASQGLTLTVGYEIRTGDDGEALLLLDDGTQVIVSANSAFVVTELQGTPEKPISRFFLNLGSVVTSRQGKLPPGASYEIEVPGDGIAAIRGTTMLLSYDPATGQGEIQCLEGTCFFELAGAPFELAAGEKLAFPDGEIGPMSADDINKLLEALSRRGVKLTVSICGDQTCGPGEGPDSCPQDCPAVCGDGLVTHSEQCETNEQCGEGFACAGPESQTANCLCYALQVCGDGVCDPGEDAATCAQDCGPVCGNGVCDPGENAKTCSADCEKCGKGYTRAETGECVPVERPEKQKKKCAPFCGKMY